MLKGNLDVNMQRSVCFDFFGGWEGADVDLDGKVKGLYWS